MKKGISSISLNPDTVIQTSHKILEVEAALEGNKTTEPTPPVAVDLLNEELTAAMEIADTDLPS